MHTLICSGEKSGCSSCSNQTNHTSRSSSDVNRSSGPTPTCTGWRTYEGQYRQIVSPPPQDDLHSSDSDVAKRSVSICRGPHPDPMWSHSVFPLCMARCVRFLTTSALANLNPKSTISWKVQIQSVAAELKHSRLLEPSLVPGWAPMTQCTLFRVILDGKGETPEKICSPSLCFLRLDVERMRGKNHKIGGDN